MPVPLTARAPVKFTPPALAASIARENADRARRNDAAVGVDPDWVVLEPLPQVEIVCRVPTMYERDSFASMLVRGGVVHYSRNQIRDLMLAGVTHLFAEDKFDDIRAELEELWQAGDATQDCQAKRTDRFIELMEKQAELPANRKMSDDDMNAELNAIQPSVVISDAKRVKVTAIQQDITSRYPPLQMAFADLAEQDVRRHWLCVEVYVANWIGLEHTPTGNGRGGVTRDEAEWLRGKIGGEAFDELGGFIFAMHSIDGDEEKNLASLIESSSAQTGSQAPAESTSVLAKDHGSSTGVPFIETPGTASPKTTGPSSGSTKPARKKTGRSKSTPTVEH